MAIRKIEHLIEVLPDEGDELLAEALLIAWSDDLGDQIVAVPRPEGYHPTEGLDDDWRPHGYAGYGFLFVKGKAYVAFDVPKSHLGILAGSADERAPWEAKVRTLWERVGSTAHSRKEDDASTSDNDTQASRPTAKPNEPEESQH